MNPSLKRDLRKSLLATLAAGLTYEEIVRELADIANEKAAGLSASATGLRNVLADEARVLEASVGIIQTVRDRLTTAADAIARIVKDSRFVTGGIGFVEFGVDSTVIAKLLYDFRSSTLRVVFHKSGSFATDTWQYDNVSRFEFESLRDANSVGSYYGRNIKGQYNSAPVVSGVARPDLLPAGYRG